MKLPEHTRMVTFHADGWEGEAAICQNMNDIPAPIIMRLTAGDPDAVQEVSELLPDELGTQLPQAGMDHLTSFLNAWADASGMADTDNTDAGNVGGGDETLNTEGVLQELATMLGVETGDEHRPDTVAKEAANDKTGMMVSEVAEFVASAEHLANMPVSARFGWRGQLQMLRAEREDVW